MNLILHFDINKTIIVSDASTNRGLQASIQSLLSEVCWGRYSESIPREERKASDWIPVSDIPSSCPPSSDAVTFGIYLEEHTDIPKNERRRLKTSFSASGNVGERFQSFSSFLESKMLANADGSKFYFVLPSFYRLLDFLFADDIFSTVNWRIVFRSFGVDSPVVIEEINSFLKGEHLFFTPANVERTSKYAITLPDDSGAFIRAGPGSEEVHMAMISKQKVVTSLFGAKAIQSFIESSWFGMQESDNAPYKRFAVIRDDYSWWEKNNEDSTSGKLLLVDKNSIEEVIHPIETGRTVFQVFFDDNIERDHAHIVDVRDSASFEPLPFSKTKDKVIFRAEPYLAITDSEYFVQHVRRFIEEHCWNPRK